MSKPKKLKIKSTSRGFDISNFVDKYGKKCSLQKSSAASEPCIWLGIDDPEPQILALDAYKLGLPGGTPFPNGWVKYSIPEQVLLSTRMHLNIDQVKSLLPVLNKFVETGEID